MATFLDTVFYGFDHTILSAWHSAATAFESVLTPLFRALTFVGEKGILLFLLAALLMCRPRTRSLGVSLFGAVSCGALITNIILKEAVERVRPFLASSEYENWWKYVGAPEESGFSFPSGHVTAAAAGAFVFLLIPKKKLFAKIGMTAYVVLMACARNYLMAHYPTDVLAAILVGFVSAFVARKISRFIYRVCFTRWDTNRICRFILFFDVLAPTKWKHVQDLTEIFEVLPVNENEKKHKVK